MRQPATGFNTCSACNASYESEAKLREHQRISHRGAGSEERLQAAAVMTQSKAAQT
jgi:hypothetical protein